MLIGNFTVLNKNVGRNIAGGTTAFAAGVGSDRQAVRSNYNAPSDWRKFGWQDRGGASGSIQIYAAKPGGYYPPTAWALPSTAGGLSSYYRITAAGSLTGSIAGGVNGTAGLTGTGTISSATAALIVSAIASLTGSGTISTANAQAFLNAVAALTGSSTATGTATALGNMVGPVTASGDAGGSTASAIGSMAAAIVSYGELTPNNLAQYVWNLAIEGGMTAGQLMKLVSAALAGKVSGAAGTNVVIRDVNDTKNRISATVDSSGDRTAITYDLT